MTTFSKAQSVKSNARRAARALGVDPELVTPAPGGGFHFPLPRDGVAANPPKKSKAAKPAKPTAKKTKAGKSGVVVKAENRKPRNGELGGNRKIIRDAITAKGGATMKELVAATGGMKEHAIRARISELHSAKLIVNVERERLLGTTTYTAERPAA